MAKRTITVPDMIAAGRLMAANAFKVGFGYRVVLPVAIYRTWQGTMLENTGVTPHVQVNFLTNRNFNSDDEQLYGAIAAIA